MAHKKRKYENIESYEIWRVYNPELNKKSHIVKTNLSLKNAEMYCNSEASHKKGEWFDCYRKTKRREQYNSYNPRGNMHHALELVYGSPQ